jgi:hypothetical protein
MARTTDGAGKAGTGALLGPILALAYYAIFWFAMVLALTALLPDLGGSKFWKLATFWLAYAVPAIVVPALAALTVGMILGAAARRASYWTILAVLALFCLLFSAWGILSGGGWGLIAALVFVGSAYLAWRILRRAALDRSATVG